MTLYSFYKAFIKKEEKKTSIMEASLKLFSTKGFYNTTIPDIAKSLGMSVGNMYNYFKSKEVLAIRRVYILVLTA